MIKCQFLLHMSGQPASTLQIIDSPEACSVMSSVPTLRTSALHTIALACMLTSSLLSALLLPSEGRGQGEGQTLHKG